MAVSMLTVEALVSFLWHSAMAFLLLEAIRGHNSLSELHHANMAGFLAISMILGLVYIVQETLFTGFSFALQPYIIIVHAVVLTILMCQEFLTALCGWRWQHIHSFHPKIAVTS
ncbi:hypothetical protein CDD82_4067 [Ophiocordyceps australis]|uniref:Uncharacterized protein n=1 Tax=Ophiocordyceps australis TaxID=1399860 RepID=A0A2C5Z351_9HYPO|nr:hypothetical protein CDD82_4067 [Ophiocordyceps australis]